MFLLVAALTAAGLITDLTWPSQSRTALDPVVVRYRDARPIWRWIGRKLPNTPGASLVLQSKLLNVPHPCPIDPKQLGWPSFLAAQFHRG